MANIRVLIVDDSITTTAHLRYIIEQEEEMSVCGSAHNGPKAIQQVERLKPNIVVMDLNMPGMNGYRTTKEILKETAVPIVICSATWEPGEVAKTFRAIEAGAVTAIPKPPGIGHRNFAKHAAEFTTTIKLMSEVRVVRRRIQKKPKPQTYNGTPQPQGKVEVIGIGASTGGPLVLQEIFQELPSDFSVPIVVVQHIAQGFIDGLVMWLRESCSLNLKIAQQDERLAPGNIYFPPDDCHFGIQAGLVKLDGQAPKENGLRPAIGYTFRSLAQQYGAMALGILLTGMGSDGAAELKTMADKGAMTIAQDQDSSAVFGMPAAAVALGGVNKSMNPVQIQNYLLQLGKQ